MTQPPDSGVTGSGATDSGAAAHAFLTLSSREVFRGRILALRADTVVMPDERTAIREVVEHFGAVAIVALDTDDTVILVDQYRHPMQRRMLELPAGLLDVAGEDPVDAARRELAEEVGLAADRWSLLVDVAASPGFTDEVIRVYLARGLRPVERDVPQDEEADMTTVRMSLAEAVRAVLDGRIANGTAVSGILAAAVSSGPDGPVGRPTDTPFELRPTALDRRIGGGDR